MNIHKCRLCKKEVPLPKGSSISKYGFLCLDCKESMLPVSSYNKTDKGRTAPVVMEDETTFSEIMEHKHDIYMAPGKPLNFD